MSVTEPQVLADILELMTKLAGDWEYSGTVTPDTQLLADLNMESLDLVVLGTALQERYGRLPFTDFLAEIGQRPIEQRDITVRELVDFVCLHSGKTAGGVPR